MSDLVGLTDIKISLCITTMDRYDKFLNTLLKKYFEYLQIGIINEIVICDENGNDYKKIYPPNQRKMKNNHVFDEDSDENSDKDVDFKFEKVHKERSPENHMNVTKDSGDEYKEDTEVFTIYELKLLKDFYERLNKLTNSELNTMNKIFAKTFPAVSNDDMVRVRFTLGQRFQNWEIEKLHKLNLKEKVTWTKTIIQGSKTVFNLRYEDLSKVVQLKRLVGHSNFSKLNKESVIKWKNFVDKGLPNLTYEEVTILKSWFGKRIFEQDN
jgi:hypothetical protein